MMDSECSFGQNVALGVLKSTVFLYDILTLPVYYMIQKPWKHLRPKTRGIPLDKTNLYSPVVKEPSNLKRIRDVKSVSEMFRRIIAKGGDNKCFGTRKILREIKETQPDGRVFKKFEQADEFEWVTFNEVDKRIDTIVKALMALGVRAHDKVAIFAETRLEWMLVAQACFRMNAPIVTLFAILGEDGVVHSLNSTEVQYVFTSFDLMPKVQKLLPDLPYLKQIIYMEGVSPPAISPPRNNLTIRSFSEFEQMSASCPEKFVIDEPEAHDLAFLMFTSGSEGIPKGVLLTHGNLVFTTTTFSVSLQVGEGHSYMAYLPLAHVMEITVEMMVLWDGQSIAYSSPLTLTNKSTGIIEGKLGDIMVAKPSTIAAVPLVMDRIKKGIIEGAKEKGPFASALLNFSVQYKKFWFKKGYKTPILNKVLFKRLRDMLGGRLHIIATGGAPLSQETQDFLTTCLSVNVIPSYGLTEVCASGTLGVCDDRTSGHSGYPLSDVSIRLVDWEEGGYHVADLPHPRGEIVVGGGNVAAGYFNNPELTELYFSEENGIRWFHTGDIGELLPNGALKVVDRKKDLIKLQYGEYVALGKVEAELKTCAFIENLCLIANSYKDHLVVLIVPNADKLRKVAEHLGKDPDSKELYSDPDVSRYFTKLLHDYGLERKLSKQELPRYCKLCIEEWMPDSGLVTAGFKIRRKQIEQFYQRDITTMYSSGISA